MSKTYGMPPPAFGQMIAGVYMRSRSQAILMREMLEREMVIRAGTPQETALAYWHREVASVLRKAEENGWAGWQGDERAA